MVVVLVNYAQEIRMTNYEILQKIIELLEDLQWEYDRMSSCGRKTVEQLETYAQQLMKVKK